MNVIHVTVQQCPSQITTYSQLQWRANSPKNDVNKMTWIGGYFPLKCCVYYWACTIIEMKEILFWFSPCHSVVLNQCVFFFFGLCPVSLMQKWNGFTVIDGTIGLLCLTFSPVSFCQNVASPIIPMFVQYRTFPLGLKKQSALKR